MSKRLQLNYEAKIISLIISSLNDSGEALLTNRQLADMAGISTKTVQRKMKNILNVEINNVPLISRKMPEESNNIGFIYSIN